MQQFQCGYCGYDMTGVEQFSNSLDTMMLNYMDGIMPIGVQGLYDSTASNTVRCPRCGRAGCWNNRI